MEEKKTNDVLTKPYNGLGAGDDPSKDKRVVEGGEVAAEVANFASGEALASEGKRQKRVFFREELDRTRHYAKKVKAKPWSEDIVLN